MVHPRQIRQITLLLLCGLLRRTVPEGVEFTTIMWFADLDAVRAFVGDDYEVAHVPEHARAALSRFDERSSHHEVLDRREQTGSAA